MKAASLILSFIIIISFCSCTDITYHALPFEGKNVRAECMINGKFHTEIVKEDKMYSLSVILPKEIAGVEFIFSESGDYLKTEKLNMSISREDFSGIFALCSMFCVSEELMTSAMSRNGCGELTFIMNDIEYTLIFDKNGYLTSVAILCDTFQYNVEILSMKIY